MDEDNTVNLTHRNFKNLRFAANGAFKNWKTFNYFQRLALLQTIVKRSLQLIEETRRTTIC